MSKNVSWLTKYHPTTLTEFVGNGEQVIKLKEWMSNFKNKTSDSYPIAYIYGNTGIGKTSIAYIIFKMFGYEVYELNSSEIRSKKRMEDIVEKILGHKTIQFIKKTNRKKSPSCIALLMDETDGMSCGDKGGLHHLFEIIDKTKTNGVGFTNPIICVGTKQYDKKNNESIMCDFHFEPPTTEEIKQRCMQIIEAEHLHIEQSAVTHLIEFCKHDIRKIIVTLQELHDFFPDTPILNEHVECVTSLFEEKEIDNDLFNVTEELYSNVLPSGKIYHYYQLEPNLIPMMLYENIPNQFERKKLSHAEMLSKYQKILDYLTVSDLIENTALIHTELYYHCSILKCETINNMIPALPVKNIKKEKKIKFTGTLSKSALISNNAIFLTNFTLSRGISQNYLPFLFEYIYIAVNNISQNNREINNLQSNLCIGQMDYEKIIQFCQKWFSITALSVVKLKRDIKKFLLKDTTND